MSDDEFADEADTPLHPRFRERRAEIEDASLRRRNRKFLALGALVLAGLLAWAATQSALFDVDEVRVIGAQRTSPDYFREIAAVDLGEPILGLDTSAIEDRLRGLPEIQDVLATASWSGVVTVEVAERLPAARLESLDGTVIIGADGLVIDVIDAPEPLSEPVDTESPDDAPVESESAGDADPVDPESAVPADVLMLPEISGAMFSIDAGEQVPDVLDEALQVANALPQDLEVITDRIEITVDSLVLRVIGGGSISLGDGRDLDQKFEAVRAFLVQVDLTCLDTLNVAAPRVPVIVRNDNC